MRKCVLRTVLAVGVVTGGSLGLYGWGGPQVDRATPPQMARLPHMDVDPPGEAPTVFAPGVVSTSQSELSPSVSPDLREFYFSRLEEGRLVLHVMVERDGRWTAPGRVPFGSDYSEDGVFVTPDNRRAYYSSMRPGPGENAAHGDYDLWFVDRTALGWGTPTHLAMSANAESQGFAGEQGLSGNDFNVSVARSGNLYFASARPGGKGSYDIYVAIKTGTGYLPPQSVSPNINTAYMDGGPAIAPDERYLVFSSDRPPLAEGDFGNLYVSFRNADGSWAAPVSLGDTVNSNATDNSPALSPRGDILFFASKRAGNFDIYWMTADLLSRATSAVGHAHVAQLDVASRRRSPLVPLAALGAGIEPEDSLPAIFGER